MPLCVCVWVGGWVEVVGMCEGSGGGGVVEGVGGCWGGGGGGGGGRLWVLCSVVLSMQFCLHRQNIAEGG